MKRNMLLAKRLHPLCRIVVDTAAQAVSDIVLEVTADTAATKRGIRKHHEEPMEMTKWRTWPDVLKCRQNALNRGSIGKNGGNSDGVRECCVGTRQLAAKEGRPVLE